MLTELKTQLSLALASGDDAEVMRLSGLIVKQKTELARAESKKLQAEHDALAGRREALEGSLYDRIMGVMKASELLDVKVKSFIVTVSHNEDAAGKIDTKGTVKVTGACRLQIPAMKGSRSTNGGSTGKLKDSTGLSRSELIARFATAEEKASVDKAFATAEKRPDAARYVAQTPVVKRILGEHPELIK